MSYQHIENLYKTPNIFLFRECYALEKIHGTSAHVSWRGTEVATGQPDDFMGLVRGNVHLFPGGEGIERFRLAVVECVRGGLPGLADAFRALGHPAVTVYGEAYGGKCMKMKETYGDRLRFVAFEVRVGEQWLSVLQAADVCEKLGIPFVHFEKIPTTIEALDAARNAPSVQAVRNGIAEPRPREGIVCRPLVEFTTNNGHRVIAKYKNDAFKETQTTRQVVSPEKLALLTAAEEIAAEWVTPMRLEHVLDKRKAETGAEDGIEASTHVIRAMIEDVRREAAGEIAWSKEAEKAIGAATAKLFRARLNAEIGKDAS